MRASCAEGVRFSSTAGVEEVAPRAVTFTEGESTYPIDGDRIVARVRLMDSRAGAFASHFEIDGPPAGTVRSRAWRTGEAAFGIQVPFSCDAEEMSLPGARRPALLDRHSIRVYLSRHGEASVRTSLRRRCSIFSFGYSLDFLRRLRAAEALPRFLRAAVDGERPDETIARAPLPPPLLRIAAEAAANPYEGRIAALFTEARLLEALAAFCAVTDERRTPGATGPDRRGAALALEAREILVARALDPPSLLDLAELLGTSHKRLNRAFSRRFGSTVGAFVRDRRLALAHRAVVDTSESLATIARRFGYSHVNNFIAAYRRRFGSPPGAARRR